MTYTYDSNLYLKLITQTYHKLRLSLEKSRNYVSDFNILYNKFLRISILF